MAAWSVSRRRRLLSNRRGETIVSKTVALIASALLCLLVVSTASLRAQATLPPDFTGVYLPIDPFGQARGGRAAVPPPAAVAPPAGTRGGALPPPRPVLV